MPKKITKKIDSSAMSVIDFGNDAGNCDSLPKIDFSQFDNASLAVDSKQGNQGFNANYIKNLFKNTDFIKKNWWNFDKETVLFFESPSFSDLSHHIKLFSKDNDDITIEAMRIRRFHCHFIPNPFSWYHVSLEQNGFERVYKITPELDFNGKRQDAKEIYKLIKEYKTR